MTNHPGVSTFFGRLAVPDNIPLVGAETRILRNHPVGPDSASSPRDLAGVEA